MNILEFNPNYIFDPFQDLNINFIPPDHIRESLIELIIKNQFKTPTSFEDKYKQAIVHWYKKRFNYNISPNWICSYPNPEYAISRLLIVINPNNKPISFVAATASSVENIAGISIYPIYPYYQESEEFNFNIFETLCSKIKVFIIRNPSELTGKLWSTEELEKLISICKKYNVYLVSYDIYPDFVYESQKYNPVLQSAEKLDYLSHTIIVSTSTKTFNTDVFNDAYLLIPNQEIRTSMQHIISHQFGVAMPNLLGGNALILGYENGDLWLNQVLEVCYSNIVFIRQYLKENLPKLFVEKTTATYFIWINIQYYFPHINRIFENLLNLSDLNDITITQYKHKATLKLNIATNRENIQKALDIIHMGFKDIK